MSAPRMPWFRMYTDFLNDSKMISLAFEDQRHFIGILALKSDGAIDDSCDEVLLDRIVAQRMWIDHGVIRDVKKRLVNAGLIESNWQPVAWDKRQRVSDRDSTAAERKRRERASKVNKSSVTQQSRVTKSDSHATVTRLDTDTDTEEDKEVDKKNTRAVAPPEGVAPSLWTDFKKLRAAKKAAITDTAIQGISREAMKAGISLSDALTMCCERGWIAFRADWYENAMTAKPAAMTARNNTHKYAGAAAAIWGNDNADERTINV